MGERMTRAKKMCKTCIFRDIGDDDWNALAVLPPEYVPCHTEDPFGAEGVQCRGHHEARRQYALADDIREGASG